MWVAGGAVPVPGASAAGQSVGGSLAPGGAGGREETAPPAGALSSGGRGAAESPWLGGRPREEEEEMGEAERGGFCHAPPLPGVGGRHRGM